MQSIKVLWHDVLARKSFVELDSVEGSPVCKKESSLDSVRRYYFNLSGNEIYLTSREMQVLVFIFENVKMPEIAKLTHLSVRTIEYYLCHIRQKFKCQRTAQVICLIKSNQRMTQEFVKNKVTLLQYVGVDNHLLN